MPASKRQSFATSRYSSSYWREKKAPARILKSLRIQVARSRHWKTGHRARRASEAKCTYYLNRFLMDERTTIAALRRRVSSFRDERDWLKDNTPKNLAISICVE